MRITASVLNLRSGPGTDFRVLGQLLRHAEVEVRERHGDWAWVSPGGWVHAGYLEETPSVAVAEAPVGRSGIVAMFGEPGTADASAGRAKLPHPLPLSWNKQQKVMSFACHEKMEKRFTRVFKRIADEGFWQHMHTFGGCYNDRAVKGSRKKSTHAWGISVDLNTETNQMRTAGDMHPDIVRIFKEEGFVWGGDFGGRSRDPMHFQFATGY